MRHPGLVALRTLGAVAVLAILTLLVAVVAHVVGAAIGAWPL